MAAAHLVCCRALPATSRSTTSVDRVFLLRSMTEQPVHDALGLLSRRVDGQSTPIVADDPVFAVAFETDHCTPYLGRTLAPGVQPVGYCSLLTVWAGARLPAHTVCAADVRPPRTAAAS